MHTCCFIVLTCFAPLSSYVQIYNDRVFDLLAVSPQSISRSNRAFARTNCCLVCSELEREAAT